MFSRYAFTFSSLQLLPARGRKRHLLPVKSLQCRFQLIPAKPSQALRASFPVRGRKLVCIVPEIQCSSTISIKGRKPILSPCLFARFRTIPVRGRKHVLVTEKFVPDCTIPVRGQKTPHQKKMRSFSFANLNFLFSVGCPSMNGTIAAAVIFSLLRLLHGDKMCYNKSNSKHLLQNRQIHFPFIVQFFHNS